jgi:hypothetical protein
MPGLHSGGSIARILLPWAANDQECGCWASTRAIGHSAGRGRRWGPGRSRPHPPCGRRSLSPSCPPQGTDDVAAPLCGHNSDPASTCQTQCCSDPASTCLGETAGG